MQNYEKPEVILMTECSEGVYLASGGQTGEDPTAGECDSRYMKGMSSIEHRSRISQRFSKFLFRESRL